MSSSAGLCAARTHAQSGGAISVGIDEFKVVSSSGALTQPAVSLTDCQLLGNMATDTGGAISVISGALVVQVTLCACDWPSACMHLRQCPHHTACAAQGTTISGNTAGSSSGTTGLGGGIYMQDSCSGGTCTAVSANLLSSTLSANYAHLVGE